MATIKSFDPTVYRQGKSWVWREAAKLADSLDKRKKGGTVIFATGYGPSGLPHMGTLAEVMRSGFVRNAFALLTGRKTELILVSDDMDALRSVPENIPNPDLLSKAIGLPLSSVPNPFDDDAPSFAHHNNRRLINFLNAFNLDYKFMSSSKAYLSGVFDEGMKAVLAHHEEIRDTVRPTLGPERRKNYSPFLPVSPKTGRILQTEILDVDLSRSKVAFKDEDGKPAEAKVTGGGCKLQWKADWGMRWKVLGVDYEMAGKDLISSYRISSKICRIIGGVPPTGMIYEHFLDERGRKISKSLGNGITVDEWLKYAPRESLSYLMFLKPSGARRVGHPTVGRMISSYYRDLSDYLQAAKRKDPKVIENPVWHLFVGHDEPSEEVPALGFDTLINLIAACQTDDEKLIWRYIRRYLPDLSPSKNPKLAELVRHAGAYYRDVSAGKERFSIPDETAIKALTELDAKLEADETDADALQRLLFDLAQRHDYKAPEFFKILYSALLGSDHGPRLGQLLAILGKDRSRKLIAEAIARAKNRPTE